MAAGASHDEKDVSRGRPRARTETGKPLPKTLPGAVCAQWVRCGRPNCRCARGELHGPYWYRFYRSGGRLMKQYVRREDVEAVRAACDRRRREEQGARRGLGRGMITWRDLARLLKEIERNG